MSENAARGSMQKDLRHDRGGAFGIFLTPKGPAETYEEMHMHAVDHALKSLKEQCR
jgi:hypothetical protein